MRPRVAGVRQEGADRPEFDLGGEMHSISRVTTRSDNLPKPY
jgi:hypothetical protein